ncbi:HVO_A0114 family putative DNA-binding protein [Methanobrevibacter filiformis]|uniref:Uncharacterized protein n=1 Tax=Methanobrevibacter filiformis TaxID=55758 RepID=A0A166A4B7_9EURY|nr:hypothetical protein [Methanobrevibacter filiformis]KZX11544.1 hypothetical protein MBFIL_14200 [Methanobrevibacter filiformis]
MEIKHNTINDLENKIKRNNSVLDRVDLENWKIFKKDPNETLKELITHFPEKIHALYIDFELLELIKKEKPESVNEVVQLINDNIYNITQKLDYLEANGLIEFDKKNKPVVNYDKIEIII